MAWIPNVNPSELIESAWGNTIRDHVVNTFASAAERDAAIPTPTPGMVTWRADTGRIEEWRVVNGTGRWRPPIGTIMRTDGAALADVNAGAAGLFDIPPAVAQGVVYPFETLSFATVVVYAGFGASFVNSQVEIVGFGSGVAQAGTPGPVQAIAAAWAALPLPAVWGNAVNTDVGFKARINVTQSQNFHTGGSATLQVVVHV